MARGRRGRRNYYNYGYYNNRWYNNRRKNMNSKAWGNMKAAKQQADQANITINVPTTITCFAQKATLTYNGKQMEVVKGVRAINIYDLLRRSEFYTSYCTMYDEFKIDKIKVKLLPTAWSVSTDTNYKNITIYTAWDRSGLSKDQVVMINQSLTNTAEYLGNANNSDGLYCIVGDDITTYSSSESRVVNPNTNTSIVRWLNPKTLQERSQWLSTSLLRKWYREYDDTGGRFYDIPTGRVSYNQQTGVSTGEFDDAGISEVTGPWVADATTSSGAAQSSASVVIQRLSAANKENPCYLLEDSGFGFKPTLLVGTYPPVESTDPANVVHFNIEAEIVCTFRGLRKAKVVQS